MLALTDNAIDAIQGILSSPTIPDGAGVRIAPADEVDAGGAQLQVTVATEPAASDEVIEDGTARVFVDDAASGFLDDKLLDASVVDEQVQFMLAAQVG